MDRLELAVPPLAQLLLVGLAMLGYARALPAFTVPVPAGAWAAPAVAGAGVLAVYLGVREFRRAQTTVDPRTPEKAVSLVTGGIYRLTRNPMYLGMLLVLIGWGLQLGNLLSLALLPCFVIYMVRFQIQPEERHMRVRFGDAYDDYCRRVRRWL